MSLQMNSKIAAPRSLVTSPDGRLALSYGCDVTPDPKAALHVHFDALISIGGTGWLVAGWVVDPGRCLTGAVFVGCGDVVLADLALKRAAPGPAGDGSSFPFLGLLPQQRGSVGLTVTLEADDGAALTGLIWPTGNVQDVEEFIGRCSFEAALAAMQRLVDQHRVLFGDNTVIASQIDEVLETFYGRIQKNPLEEASLGMPIAAYLDVAQRVGAIGILLKGWVVHVTQDKMVSVTLKSFFGRQVQLDLPLPASTRLDVVEALASTVPGGNLDCGIVAFAPCADVHAEDKRWFAEFATMSGSLFRIPFRLAVPTSPRKLAEEVSMWAEETVIDAVDLYARALGPALSELWRLALEQKPHPKDNVYGRLPEDPEVSIIIPLYGRVDFLKHQIANFANDADFRHGTARAELIYVLDDPRRAKEVALLADTVAKLYDVPFRLVDLRANFGYSTANNVGASVARGKYLILLNSDIIPKAKGWVSQLLATAETVPSLGALGCRLLFDDGSIQHAGMEFRPAPVLPGTWLNHHSNKGLAVSFDPVRGQAEVPAVTGACLLTPRAVFAELGGLSTNYIIGDFEDSDYCLKARQSGRAIVYTSEVELYHLERQSMRMIGDGRYKLTLFNMWQHTNRWGDLIEQVMDAPGV
ncbi:glycosyltransferase family 2 protein [Oryzibacter oryziterrae]|uniref:glycosyltransferase family 2 protein n=1 Tax=Oryzibacter oryziterrae TaxID=2766474 RepID=UPI001F2AB85A|nr:glycosyltransferase family 2 protein [Oryzibacter oryziterrae]